MSSNRTFTIHEATTIKGCRTKVPHESRYHSSNASDAAKKAHTTLCGRKRIKGSCTFIITMRETTQGSVKKLYTYKVSRRRLTDPVELDSGVTFEYETIAKKAHQKKKSKNCRRQSPGRIRKRKSKRHRKRKSKRHRRRRRSHMSSSAKSIISAVDSGLSNRSNSRIRRIPKSVSSRKAAAFLKKWKKSKRSSKRSKKAKSTRRRPKCSGKRKKSCRKSKTCRWNQKKSRCLKK
jgi:hypothetical protein